MGNYVPVELLNRKEFEEGREAFVSGIVLNPYPSPEGVILATEQAWFIGYERRVNEEENKAFEEGRKANALGLLAKANPSSDEDVVPGPKYRVMDYRPQYSWAKGYATGKKELIDRARDENREVIDNCVNKIKWDETEYIKNYEAAYNGNIFSHGLSHLKSKKICKNIWQNIISSRELAILQSHYYEVVGRKEGLVIHDASSWIIKSIVDIREETPL